MKNNEQDVKHFPSVTARMSHAPFSKKNALELLRKVA